MARTRYHMGKMLSIESVGAHRGHQLECSMGEAYDY